MPRSPRCRCRRPERRSGAPARLGQRPVGAANRDHGVRGADDEPVAHLAETGRDRDRDTHSFASARSGPGSSPIVIPPALAAPRQAASITPPRPPQMTVAPARASSEPHRRGDLEPHSRGASRGPDDRDVRRGRHDRRSADDDVDELVGHDDHLDDLVAVDVRLHAARLKAQALELLARGAGRRAARGRGPCR